ncbi:MAG: hypothetical protein JRF61_00510 [Deltaproteobacteria bacterium]|jgi:hypothetical protein|nr:hypothetical protein [Deltaproteobacteria bacterium]
MSRPASRDRRELATDELIYQGDGRLRSMYSIPGLFGLTDLDRRWRADGQHESYAEIDPGLTG